MEQNDYLCEFGKCFKNVRKEKKLTQVGIYRVLYPDVENSEENIKKLINKIENGKMKTLNADLVIRFCKTFNVSSDFLLGINRDYTNHELEFVCEYTGLEETAVNQLHEWNIDKNNGSDISKLGEAFFAEEEEEHLKMHRKQMGIAFLRIVNYLFKSGTKYGNKKKGKGEQYSNLSILYSLYLLSMAKPKEVYASVIPDDYLSFIMHHYPNLGINLDYVSIDHNSPITLVDNNNVHYILNPKTTLEHYGKMTLNDSVEWLIQQVKNDDFAVALANSQKETEQSDKKE